MFWVYILECSNRSYYCGYTNDLQKRFQTHLAGQGAKYTRSFKPLKIMQAWHIFTDKSLAQKIEAHIKSMTRQEKETLIQKPELLVEKFGSEAVAVWSEMQNI